MDDKEFYSIRTLEAQRWLAQYFSEFIECHAKLVKSEKLLKKLSKIKEPTDREKRDKEVYQSHITAYKQKAQEAQEQVQTLRSLIEEYSKNEPVKL